jgi:hypothetical protein
MLLDSQRENTRGVLKENEKVLSLDYNLVNRLVMMILL